MKSRIFVDNIKCDGCVSTIQQKLNAIDQISNVQVDIEAGSVTFECQNDDCRLNVISTLKKSGYPKSGSNRLQDNAKSNVVTY